MLIMIFMFCVRKISYESSKTYNFVFCEFFANRKKNFAKFSQKYETEHFL